MLIITKREHLHQLINVLHNKYCETCKEILEQIHWSGWSDDGFIIHTDEYDLILSAIDNYADCTDGIRKVIEDTKANGLQTIREQHAYSIVRANILMRLGEFKVAPNVRELTVAVNLTDPVHIGCALNQMHIDGDIDFELFRSDSLVRLKDGKK